MKDCARGEIYRKSYTRTRKNGKRIHVKGACIPSQTRYSSSPSTSCVRMRGFPIAKRTLRSCPKGYIKRAAYVRSSKRGARTHVPEQCIRDRGLPGKGFRGSRGIGPLRKGELTKYGYQTIRERSVSERRTALRKAIQEFGSLGVWRKLNAIAVYTKHTSPALHALYKEDMNWIRNEFGIKAFSPHTSRNGKLFFIK